jgi:tetratricopeptide (TPR) repeat protein
MVLVLGCAASDHGQRPQNPILENSQAALEAVESRLRASPAPTPADDLELGIARHQVWEIYLSRSRYQAIYSKTRREAEANRRAAERLEPEVMKPLARAADQSGDPAVAASAKVWLARVYAEKGETDKQIEMLRRILREHKDLEAPAAFGMGGTPRYYCYYTLAGAYQAKGDRNQAIDAMARALLATSMVGNKLDAARNKLLGRMLDYEPRLVLPKYQRRLPTDVDKLPLTTDLSQRHGPAPALGEMLKAHRQAAPNRIRLTVEHTDGNGLLVAYQVEFPSYPAIIKAWEEDQKKPHPRLGDDFSGMRPSYLLSFATLPTTDGFFGSKYAESALVVPRMFTPPLAFDDQGRAAGKMILVWADGAARPQKLYLAAKLVGTFAGIPAGPVVSGEKIFLEPVEVELK